MDDEVHMLISDMAEFISEVNHQARRGAYIDAEFLHEYSYFKILKEKINEIKTGT